MKINRKIIITGEIISRKALKQYSESLIEKKEHN